MIMDNIVAYDKFEWEKILQLVDKMSSVKKEYMANFNKIGAPILPFVPIIIVKLDKIY